MNTSEHTPQHASHTPEERPTSTVQKRSYTEHRILRGASAIYARHYAGTGPAFVLMHGFPDNLHIYQKCGVSALAKALGVKRRPPAGGTCLTSLIKCRRIPG